MNIIVLSLFRGITKGEVQALFDTFGTVDHCELVVDKNTGLSKGFAFVNMPNQNEAEMAIMMLNNKRVRGNRIRVKEHTGQ